MFDSRAGAGNIQVEPGTFCGTESKDALNERKGRWRHIKQTPSQLTERVSKGQIWNKLSNKIKTYWIMTQRIT